MAGNWQRRINCEFKDLGKFPPSRKNDQPPQLPRETRVRGLSTTVGKFATAFAPARRVVSNLGRSASGNGFQRISDEAPLPDHASPRYPVGVNSRYSSKSSVRLCDLCVDLYETGGEFPPGFAATFLVRAGRKLAANWPGIPAEFSPELERNSRRNWRKFGGQLARKLAGNWRENWRGTGEKIGGKSAGSWRGNRRGILSGIGEKLPKNWNRLKVPKAQFF